MKHGIAGFAVGSGFTEISEDEFKRVRRAKHSLVRILSLEAKFDLMLENYVDFERKLLELGLYQMIYSDLSWGSMHSDIQNLNRRITNLLSSGRLYLDHIMHDVAALDSTEDTVVASLRTKCSEQYDRRLGYRVMEALRNHTQHRGLPVHQLSYPASWEPPLRKNLVYRVVPSLKVAELREDGHFKASIIRELDEVGPTVPVTPLVREYVEGLSSIHEAFRDLSQKDIQDWEAHFEWAWKCYADTTGDPRRTIRVVVVDDGGQFTESEDIFEDLIGERKNLVKKNAVLTNLALRFVSGSCDLRDS
jgi:hypothetical protein